MVEDDDRRWSWNFFDEFHELFSLAEYAEDIGQDPIDYGGKIGTKKRMKLEAKEEKRQAREVNSRAKFRMYRMIFSKNYVNVRNVKNVTRNSPTNVVKKN